MSNARQKILNYIVEQQSTTVEELSKVFRVTPANIRHHLSILVGQGSIKVIGQKPPLFRGRPAQIYSDARQTNRNNLDQLADVLLSNILEKYSQDEISTLLKQIARQMIANFPLDINNPTRRMYSSIRILNHLNYQAHWEAHIENPRIMLGHCPYSSILSHHPQICQLDSFLLEELLNAPVTLIEKLTINAKSLPQCVFLLNRSSL